MGGDWTCHRHVPERHRREQGVRGYSPWKFRNSRWQEMQSGHIFEENEAFNWSQKCRFFRVNFCSSQREIEEIQAAVKIQQWKMKIFFFVLPQGHTLISCFFYSLPEIGITSNTFQFWDDSESKSAINKTSCGHRLHWFKKIKSDLLFSIAEWNYNREREKSKYLNNISVLPTSIFIFDKFVDGAQPEVAGDFAGTCWESWDWVVMSLFAWKNQLKLSIFQWK